MVSFKKKKIIFQPKEKIYNLVADVRKYPTFLPWCNEIKIKEKKKNYILTEVKVGFRNINETYVCKVILHPKKKISLEYISGPFEYLEIDWKFKKITKDKTDVSFFCNFKFKSILLRISTSFFLESAVEKMVYAFEKKLNSNY